LGSVGALPAVAVDSVIAVAWTVPNPFEKSTMPSLTVRTVIRFLGCRPMAMPTAEGNLLTFTPNSVPRARAVATSVRMAYGVVLVDFCTLVQTRPCSILISGGREYATLRLVGLENSTVVLKCNCSVVPSVNRSSA
jgi:hypothetical protein